MSTRLPMSRVAACWGTRILLCRFGFSILCAIRDAIFLPSFLPSTDQTLLRVAREGYSMLIQRDREGNQMATPRRQSTNPAPPDKQRQAGSFSLLHSRSLGVSDKEGKRFQEYSLRGRLSACVCGQIHYYYFSSSDALKYFVIFFLIFLFTISLFLAKTHIFLF